MTDDGQGPIFHGRAIILLEDDDLQDAVENMKSQEGHRCYPAHQHEHIVPAQVTRVIESVQATAIKGVYVKRRCLIFWIVIGLLLVVAVVVGATLLALTANPQTMPIPSNTSRPAQSFSLPITLDRFALSLPNYTQETLQNEIPATRRRTAWYKDSLWIHTNETISFQPRTPQGKAWQWLIADPFISSRAFSEMTLRFALATLYYATDGPNWKNTTNWLSYTDNVCTWWCDVVGAHKYGFGSYDAFCKNVGFIQLTLINNWLVGTIPPEVGLISLRYVDLAHNSIHGMIPDVVWRSWNQLQVLELQYNNITGSLPSTLGMLADLAYVDIESNRFTGTLPTEIGRLSSLAGFTAFGNAFAGQIPTEVGRIKRLKYLELFNNALTGLIPSEIGRLRNLQQANFANNQLSGPIPTEIGASRSLISLNTAGNKLTGTIPIRLGRLTALNSLILNNNSLTGSLPSRMGKLTALVVLDVSSNIGLNGTLPYGFDKLSRLARVSLFETQVSGSIPASLCGVQQQQQDKDDGASSGIVIDCNFVICACNCTCEPNR